MKNKNNNVILTIITSYGKGLLGFIRKKVDNDADAEDVLQDVWYQLSTIVNVQPIEQLGGWLYRVASNKIIDRHRKKSESSWKYHEDGDNEENNPYDLVLRSDKTPETEYQDRILWEQLYAALEELPQAQKEVFIWHELDSISFAEISERTGEPVGKLISRKHYAVLHLRKRLKIIYSEFKESQFTTL